MANEEPWLSLAFDYLTCLITSCLSEAMPYHNITIILDSIQTLFSTLNITRDGKRCV